MELTIAKDWKSSAERLGQENEGRKKLTENILPFGVKFLDDALYGICRHDLILVGASSGAGKTDLVSIISGANIKNGKRVYMFALEAEPEEIERRLKFKELSMMYQIDAAVTNREYVTYKKWYYQKTKALDKYEQYLDPKKYENLFTRYKSQDFGVDQLVKEVLALQNLADLIIIDHLHYIDLDDEKLENRSISKIMKACRDLALLTGVPIILVAHLRKKSFHDDRIVPTQEDFHGSSDIYKIATKVITIAPDLDKDKSLSKYVWPTFFHIPKDRQDSTLTRYVGSCLFDVTTASYNDSYAIGELKKGGTSAEWINDSSSEKYPHWAKR